MKTNIRRDGDFWVVETNNRVVPVEHWDTAVRIANGPTGKERKCGTCGDPISRDPYRPVGVKGENRAGYCYSCGKGLAPSVRGTWGGKRCVGGCGVVMHTHGGVGRGPGTREHTGGGFCSTCHARDKAGLPLPRDPDYECVRCGCEVSTSIRPPVGVAQIGAGWRCKSCAQAVSRGATEVLDEAVTRDVVASSAGERCAGECGLVLRSARAPITPGSRRHYKDGYCSACFKASPQAQPATPARVDAPEVSAMMAARRARKASQERAEKARAFEYARYLHYKKTRQPA